MCRWEPIVTRPDPQRPPAAAVASTQMTIEVLTARIASLEQELSQAKNAIEKNERGLKALESSSTPIPTNVSRFSEEDHSPSRQGESSSSRTLDEAV